MGRLKFLAMGVLGSELCLSTKMGLGLSEVGMPEGGIITLEHALLAPVATFYMKQRERRSSVYYGN
jgi:hypothetical protein